MSGEPSWDALVVGAGPAGAASALRLARRGCQVLLLDRASFPRGKPCGECLNPGGVAELCALLPDTASSVRSGTLVGWKLGTADGRAFRGAFPSDRPGWAVERQVLDTHLVEAAAASGAEVRVGRVEEPLMEAGRVVGVRVDGRPIRARWVIGADGLRSVLAARLGAVRRPPRLRKIALTAHMEGAELEPGWGRMYIVAGGCVGIAPLGHGRANVVVVRDSSSWPSGADRHLVFDRMVRTLPELSAATRVEEPLATGPFDRPVRRRAYPGLFLVGDAGGYYDPFTGQGIRRALVSARLAAEALARMQEGADEAAVRRRYEQRFRAEARAGEMVQKGIELAVARPTLLGIGVELLRRASPVADGIVRRVGDLPPSAGSGG